MPDALPYLFGGDAEPIRAVFKARWEDFHVEELPAADPAGSGDHLWMEVEKRGLTTPRAAAEIARALGVSASSIGYAGLKDARAIARQWMSAEHASPERALAIADARLRVLRAVRHPRKLRRGGHAGNRFVLRLRPPGVVPADGAAPAADAAEPVPAPPEWSPAVAAALATRLAERLARLARVGVPNYYGPQRFGTRGDTWRIGRALAGEDWQEAAALIAGRPLRADDPAVDPSAGVHPDTGDVLTARALFDAGDYLAAAAAWPRGFAQCARLAAAMARTGGDAARALPVVGKRMLRLYASAWQAWLFNRVLAVRMPEPDRLLPGDLAWKHDSEALFPVEDVAAEQPRADRFEISPTGPLVGRRMRAPGGAVAALEAEALGNAGFDAAQLESAALRPLTGRRRPLRFAIREPAVRSGADDRGPWVELRFALPPGCYATTVLREAGRGGIIEAAAG